MLVCDHFAVFNFAFGALRLTNLKLDGVACTITTDLRSTPGTLQLRLNERGKANAMTYSVEQVGNTLHFAQPQTMFRTQAASWIGLAHQLEAMALYMRAEHMHALFRQVGGDPRFAGSFRLDRFVL